MSVYNNDDEDNNHELINVKDIFKDYIVQKYTCQNF